MKSFNLTDRSWIACAGSEGISQDLGLIEVFARAHQLRGLANESPLIDAAVFRLLLAILHRCFGPRDTLAWRELRQRGSFDMAALNAYLSEWRERLDLFHPETPFYQVARLVEQTPNYERGKKPAREMIAEQSSYGGPRELFESRPDETFAIPAATAARWLIAIQAFHTGGLLTRDVTNGDPTSVRAGPLCGSAVVTVRGETLFETLLLNLLPYPLPSVFPTDSEDAPAWERPPLTKFRKRACRGWLDWLTWQSRRIQLFGDGETGVSSFILLGGHELKAENAPLDPMCAYRKHEKFGLMPIGFSEERALWRDSAALLQTQGDENLRSARVVSELTTRKLERKRRLQLQIFGQVPNKASLVLTRTEFVPLPLALIEQPELVGRMREELGKAEDAQTAVRKSLFYAFQSILSLGDRTPDAKDVSSLIDNTQAVARFWAALKPVFDRFLLDLTEEPDGAVSEFRKAVRNEAIGCFERGVLDSSTPSRTLKGFAQGRAKLLRDLATYGLVGPAQSVQELPQAEGTT